MSSIQIHERVPQQKLMHLHGLKPKTLLKRHQIAYHLDQALASGVDIIRLVLGFNLT